MDGVSGLEEGAKAVFPHATVQRCIVHLIRNSIRYIPRKQWSAFTKQLKLIYGAINVKQARQEFEKFKTDWQAYPGAVSVWENNFSHVEQLYNYGSAVRKIMYTTNAIESVNSSFRKVTKKGAFPNEDAVFKIFYLRIQELYKKWKGRHVANWAMGTSCSWTTGCLSLCSNTMLLIESIYTKLLTHPLWGKIYLNRCLLLFHH